MEAIRTYRAEYGISPSYREIGEAVGLRSTNGISKHVKALEEKGLVVRMGRKARSLRIVGDLSVFEMFLAGASISELAERYAVTAPEIEAILRVML